MKPSSFGRKRDSRNLLLRNLAASVILYESVKTTAAKASSVQPIVEHLIHIGKTTDRLTARRQLLHYLPDEKAILKILDELTPRYKDQTSGYTRRYPLAPRLGDSAPLAVIQLTKNARLAPIVSEKAKAI